MAEPADSNPLQYARRPTAARRWRWRVVFAALAITIGLLAWTRGPAVWDRAMLLYWQRQCMNYRAPVDQVVYENEPDDTVAYVAAGGTMVRPTKSGGPAVGHVPDAATQFLQRAAMQITSRECVLFMHGLTSPGGTRRLVIVTCDDAKMPAGYFEDAVETITIEPDGWYGGPSLVTLSLLRPAQPPWMGSLPRLTIYAGQVDPNDPSHFTIRFKRLEDGLIDGRLTDDGTVHLQFLGSKADGFDTPLGKP